MKFILKLYIGIHDWVHPRVMSRVGCACFDGIHPKEGFGLRFRFFRNNVCDTDRVIDVACGTGTILGHISDRIKTGVGLDLSKKQIGLAAKFNNRRNIEFLCGDIFSFDYSSLNYNVAIFSHILEHIDDVSGFLRKVNADKLLICVPSQEGWYSRLKWRLGLDVRTDVSHYREYYVDTLRLHVENAGYRVDYIGFNEDGNIVCRAYNDKE